MEDLSTLTNDELIHDWDIDTGIAGKAADRLGHIEQELQRRLEADGATEYVSEEGTVTLTESELQVTPAEVNS